MSHPTAASPVTYHQPLVSATTRAIELALSPRASDGDDLLREAMRQICVDARGLSVRPEALIVLFKARWRVHPELRVLPREEANAALDHVITMCIEEYYREPPNVLTGTRPART